MDNAGDANVRMAAQVMAPSGASGATAPMRIASTGATPLANATALVEGSFATLQVGDSAVRIAFGATSAAAIAACATTSLKLPGGARFDWTVTPLDLFVACREGTAAAGATEAWAWSSSGPRATS